MKTLFLLFQSFPFCFCLLPCLLSTWISSLILNSSSGCRHPCLFPNHKRKAFNVHSSLGYLLYSFYCCCCFEIFFMVVFQVSSAFFFLKDYFSISFLLYVNVVNYNHCLRESKVIKFVNATKINHRHSWNQLKIY